MDKENNRSAAGLRRSAIVERIRLREEWSELKGTETQTTKQTNILKKRNVCKELLNRQADKSKKICNEIQKTQSPTEVLHGIVALVSVGAEPRALALRAALCALGATVVPAWSPLVTHLVWQEGGCRATRAKARALACRLVSPLWVEACAAAARRLPSQAFPAAARASDLPSPATLRAMLKKAELENIPLEVLLSDKESDKDESDTKLPRLRLSSETERDTSNDRSKDTSGDITDKSRDTTTDVESRVNTAPRRALPKTSTPNKTKASRRKLFTQRDADETRTTGDEEEDSPSQAKRKTNARATQPSRKVLARAERLARKILQSTAPNTQRAGSHAPKIVLTGMNRTERKTVCNAIRSLNGKLQKHVNRKTTHVLLGTCRSDEQNQTDTGINNGINDVNRSIKITETNFISNDKNTSTKNTHVIDKNISVYGTNKNTSINTSITSTNVISNDKNISTKNTRGIDKNASINTMITSIQAISNTRSDILKPRTLNALLGAARGCRVLHAQWAIDSMKEKQWLHHYRYEVGHLRKISQKARIERTALSKMRSEYSYDVFNGMRVYLTENTEQKDAVSQLLTLCGAVVQDGGHIQNGDFDVVIGTGDNQVSSKWVFDSVAAARMRTTRRYINHEIPLTINTIGS